MAFDLQPTLTGDAVAARPLRDDDFAALYEVARDPLIWAQHPAHDRWRRDVFDEFFAQAMQSRGALLVSDPDGTVIGSSRYAGLDVENSRVEVGWTFLARHRWGGRVNGQLKRLMLDHAFRHVECVEFAVGTGNTRSRRALEAIGARHVGEAPPPRWPAGHELYEVRRDEWTTLRDGAG